MKNDISMPHLNWNPKQGMQEEQEQKPANEKRKENNPKCDEFRLFWDYIQRICIFLCTDDIKNHGKIVCFLSIEIA